MLSLDLHLSFSSPLIAHIADTLAQLFLLPVTPAAVEVEPTSITYGFVCVPCLLLSNQKFATRGDRIGRGDNEVCIPSKRISHSIFTFVVSQCEVSSEGHTTEDQGHLQSTQKSAGSVRPTSSHLFPVHFPYSLLYLSYLPSLPLCIMLQV